MRACCGSGTSRASRANARRRDEPATAPAIADELGVRIIPHSPYFGPGFLATLQLLSTRDEGLIEVFYMKRAACLWGGRIAVDANGLVDVPSGPGLGYEPDKAVLEQFRAS